MLWNTPPQTVQAVHHTDPWKSLLPLKGPSENTLQTVSLSSTILTLACAVVIKANPDDTFSAAAAVPHLPDIDERAAHTATGQRRVSLPPAAAASRTKYGT